MRKGNNLSLQTKHGDEMVFGLVINYEGGQIIQRWERDIDYVQLQ